MSTKVKKHLLTVANYHQMYDTGILSALDRVELIRGEIIAMSPIRSRHANMVTNITRLFYQLFSNKVIINVQNPLQLSVDSEPEPDIALLIPPLEKYKDHHPKPSDVLLIAEVADTSYEYDKELKLPLYAIAGIPQVWIINLNQQEVEVFTSPAKDKYKLRQLYFAQDKITFNIQGIEFSVSMEEIL